jgi:hypothetical protein
MYSRLLGGLLIVQRRSTVRPGACASFSGSAYSAFIDSCFDADVPDQSDFRSLDGSVV